MNNVQESINKIIIELNNVPETYQTYCEITIIIKKDIGEGLREYNAPTNIYQPVNNIYPVEIHSENKTLNLNKEGLIKFLIDNYSKELKNEDFCFVGAENPNTINFDEMY